MLEYSLNFLTQNNFLILFIVVLLFVSLFFLKKINLLFVFVIGTLLLSFLLPCLYGLGIDVGILFEWTCKFVFGKCFYHLLYLNPFLFLTKILEVLRYQSLTEIIICLIQICCILSIFILIVKAVLPNFKSNNIRKLIFNYKNLNKKRVLYNTINRQQSKFILYSNLRC